jgi:hypothetical protein
MTTRWPYVFATMLCGLLAVATSASAEWASVGNPRKKGRIRAW